MTKTAWRCEIKYGPEGEANYAWVYDADGNMVCTAKTHHAEAIVTRMNATASLQGEDAVERVARIIEPRAFENWQGLYDYGKEDNEEYRRRRADYFHKADCYEAIAKARAILATGLVAGEAERPLGDVFNELVRRMNFDGMDPRTFTLGELERAIDGAEFPK